MNISNQEATRLIRLRRDQAIDLGASWPAPRGADGRQADPRGTPRFVGKVVNGGAMPSQSERAYLVNPVRLGGPEAEGASASLQADVSRTIPVVVIGGATVREGDLLVVMSVGGRWVAELGSTSFAQSCSPCAVPRKNLTVSWTNFALGGGSTALIYNPIGQWASNCGNQLLYTLNCPGGAAQFLVTYFVFGSCPTGTRQSCASPGSAPYSLALASYSCSPFLLRYTLTGSSCSVLANSGYTSFTVTE